MKWEDRATTKAAFQRTMGVMMSEQLNYMSVEDFRQLVLTELVGADPSALLRKRLVKLVDLLARVQADLLLAERYDQHGEKRVADSGDV